VVLSRSNDCLRKRRLAVSDICMTRGPAQTLLRRSKSDALDRITVGMATLT